MGRLDELFDALADLATTPGETKATSMRQPEGLRRAVHLAVDLGMDESVTVATNHALEQRIRAFARQRALSDHLHRFPEDRPSLSSVARRRVLGSGHPAEARPELIDEIAAWLELHEPDWLLTRADETVDKVLEITEMIAGGVGTRSPGAVTADARAPAEAQ